MAGPALIPATTPVGDTVATLKGLMLHVPPGAGFQNGNVVPAHIVKKYPPIAGRELTGFTVISFVDEVTPQELTIVYEIITVPAVTPVTTPVADTVACELLALQVPPVTASVRVIAAPVITDEGPVITPAEAVLLTVTDLVACAVPHPFVIL